MTEKMTKLVVSIFGSWAATLVGKYVIVFVVSILPILELRGGLLASSLLGLPMWQSFLVCFLGNVLPIPFILWFITPLFGRLKKINGLRSVVARLEKKAKSKQAQIENLKYVGLFLFVGIPLPGTGAWTGCLIAALLGLDKKKSLLASMAGVLMAGIIMLILSYGILGNLIG